MRIGLLEDNPAIVDLFISALTLEGHAVETYFTGVSLLERLLPGGSLPAPLPYDVLIVDLGLPGGMSGWDVLAQVGEVPSFGGLSVIVVSAVSVSELERLHARFPAVTVMRKPVRMTELLQAIATSTPSVR